MWRWAVRSWPAAARAASSPPHLCLFGLQDCEKLADCIEKYTPERVAFVRVEAGTNLIGGQPFSLQNLKDVRQVRVCACVCWLGGVGGWFLF